MLFNSYFFILVFLPITVFVFFRLGSMHQARAALAWLVAASFFFYAWWNPAYLALLMASLMFNYGVGTVLASSASGHVRRRLLLIAGVGANLLVLGYFKYANFLLDGVSTWTGHHFETLQVILPLGISFITFQKIAYLVDAYQGKTREYNFLHFCLFVSFFPQLIAGPIVHHREVMPQFGASRIFRFRPEYLAVGITIFAIGLFKKVIIADNMALFATPVFQGAANGETPTLLEAWSGALAYTFQLYFDFSGYSDMAIGLARIFGIRLPVNFYSPYKAANIIDFWRRWHITLSRFLRDYLYIPLGGNRHGPVRRYLNLFITMLLGGLWHGAGWTFILWGGVHGVYLILNHAWRALRVRLGFVPDSSGRLGLWCGRVLTFLAVVFAWVLFRAEHIDAAWIMVRGMLGLNGVVLPLNGQSVFAVLGSLGVTFGPLRHDGAGLLLIVLFGVVWFAPNTIELMRRYRPALTARSMREAAVPSAWGWRATRPWAWFTAALLLASLLNMGEVSEFLYFQF